MVKCPQYLAEPSRSLISGCVDTFSFLAGKNGGYLNTVGEPLWVRQRSDTSPLIHVSALAAEVLGSPYQRLLGVSF